MTTHGAPGWRMGDGGQAPITDEDRSRSVAIIIGLHVEATDVSTLQAAVAALDGPPTDALDALDAQLRSIPDGLSGVGHHQCVVEFHATGPRLAWR